MVTQALKARGKDSSLYLPVVPRCWVSWGGAHRPGHPQRLLCPAGLGTGCGALWGVRGHYGGCGDIVGESGHCWGAGCVPRRITSQVVLPFWRFPAAFAGLGVMNYLVEVTSIEYFSGYFSR